MELCYQITLNGGTRVVLMKTVAENDNIIVFLHFKRKYIVQ